MTTNELSLSSNASVYSILYTDPKNPEPRCFPILKFLQKPEPSTLPNGLVSSEFSVNRGDCDNFNCFICWTAFVSIFSGGLYFYYSSVSYNIILLRILKLNAPLIKFVGSRDLRLPVLRLSSKVLF